MRKAFNTLLITLLSFSLFAGILGVGTPVVAAETQNVDTSTIVTVSANPAGVTQTVQINVSISPSPPTADDYFTGIIIKITDPDGHTSTLGPLKASPDWQDKTHNSLWVNYVLTKAGFYNITANYLGDTYANGGITYLPSTSNTVTLSATWETQPTPTPTATTTPMPTPTASSTAPSPTPQTKKTATLSIETEKTNSTLTVKGRLWAPETIGIAVQDIFVSYQILGETVWKPIGTSMTNEWGKYDSKWNLTLQDTFSLKAEWAGTSEYYPASNTTTQGAIPIEDQQAIVQSNSTITQITYNQTVGISFTVSGETGTQGYSKVVVPQSLMPESQNIHVYIDEKAVDFDLSADGDSWILSFSYHHSSHQVVVTNTNNSQPHQLSVDNSVWLIAGIVAIALAGAAGIIVWLAKKR